ncbi:MAG: sulfotransferase family protein [Bacteroidota bacterium]|nr:sulfotransferase family protein [Bacteroidota bacterium]
MSLKIIGTGLGRTGTHSLKLALEQLGFGKCYHMIELIQHPEGLKYFQQAEKDEHVNWEELFEGYHSAVDYPVARYYKQLIKYYPDAKIIHTIRDAESWYKSVTDTIFWVSKPSLWRILKVAVHLPFSSETRSRLPVFKFNGKLIELEFGKDLKNKEEVIRRFNLHNEEVIKTIPKERLLVFNPKGGWDPLCNFLNVPVPENPFPKSNTKDEFIQRAKTVARAKELK